MKGTDVAGDFKGTDPAERRLLYRLAIQTGLRAGEIRSLGRGDFELDRDSPFVKVSSRETKNRQWACQSIDSSLAADLRSHVKLKMPGAAAFDLPSEYDMADMIRADLTTARRLWLAEVKDDAETYARRERELFLAAENESGEALDFHALLHTTGSWLAIRGVQPKVIQSMMRHCTITLTMDLYSHLIEGAEAAAVAIAADMTATPESAPALIAQTGTDSH